MSENKESALITSLLAWLIEKMRQKVYSKLKACVSRDKLPKSHLS